MTELKHAEIICHMAKHGFESVQYKDCGEFWQGSFQINPVVHPNWEWRIKPATITYTVTVPEPMRGKPDSEQIYFMLGSSGVHMYKWCGSLDDIRITNGNPFWDTEAKAQAAFDAFFSPLRNVK